VKTIPQKEHIILCLRGKLHRNQYFNVGVVTEFLKQIEASQGIHYCDLDKNSFAFKFFAHADKDHVLNEDPWAFDRNLLLLKGILGLEHPLRQNSQKQGFG